MVSEIEDGWMINLKRRADKRETALAAISMFGWNVNVYDAIDGDALKRSGGRIKTSGKVRKTLHLSWNGKHGRMSRDVNGTHNGGTGWGTLGCQISHDRILSKRFTKQYRLVLEDDLVLQEGGVKRFKAAFRFVQERYPHWELFYIGGSPTRYAPKREVAKKLCPGLLYADSVYQSHAYLIKPTAATRVIEYLGNGSAADCALMNFCRHNRGKCFLSTF